LFGPLSQILLHGGQVSQDNGQQIVEIVSDTAGQLADRSGQLADRFEFLRLVESHLGLPVFGQIFAENEATDRAIFGGFLPVRHMRNKIRSHVHPANGRGQFVFDVRTLPVERFRHMTLQPPR